MRNRMLASYLLVAVLSLAMAYLSSILFLQTTLPDYMRENQIAACAQTHDYFQKYYQTHDGWVGADQVDINQIPRETTSREDLNLKLALVDTTGTVLFSENEAFLGYVVAETTLEIGAPIQVDGETVGYLYSGSYIENVLSGKENQLIVINQSAVTRALLFGLLIGFLLSILLTLALLRPIRLTIDSVKRIAQGDLRARVSLEPYGDMAELGQALNDMAAELEKSQQIQQLMVMDIAHDLRTPLSVQRAAIEAFEDGVYKFDQNGLNLLKIQNTHLIHLVEDLRLLALPDAGVFQIHREKIDLRTFIQDILYNFKTVFTKKDIQVDFNPYDDGYVVDIDPHLMQRVFENLLQNAYQHSPTGGLIEIRIQRKINRMAVVISNQGPGIPEEKLETIFKRYYRIPSVEKGTAEGLGLGLAISKRIVDGHGGTLYAQNSREGGAEFVLELPYPA